MTDTRRDSHPAALQTADTVVPAAALTRRDLLLSLAGGAHIALGFVFYVTSQVGAEAMP